MSAHLVTQFSEDQPLVLVVGADSWVLSQVVTQFKRYDFAVVTVPYSELTTALLLSQQWYKVVVVAGFESQEISLIQTTFQTLKSRLSIFKSVAHVRPSLHNSVLFLTPHWSYFDDDFIDIARILHSFQLLIAQQYSEINQVLIENVVAHEQLADLQLLGAPHIAYFLQSKASKKIVVPDGKIFLLSRQEFLTQLGDFLRKPMRDSAKIKRIKGIEYKNQEVAEELQRRFYVQFGLQFELVRGIFSDFREKETLLNVQNNAHNNAQTTKQGASKVYQDSLPHILNPVFEAVFVSKDSIFEQTKKMSSEVEAKPLPESVQSSIPSPVLSSVTNHVSSLVPSRGPKPISKPVSTHKPASTTPSTTSTTYEFKPTTNTPKVIVESKPLPIQPASLPVRKIATPKPSKESSSADIDDKLASLFSVERVVNKADHLQTLHTQTTQAKQKNKKRTTAFYVGSVVSFFAATTLILAGTFFASTYFLQQNLIKYLEQETATITEDAQLNQTLVMSKNFVELQLNAYSSILPPAFFYDASRVVGVIDSLEKTSQELADLHAFQRVQVLGWLGNEGSNASVSPINTQSLYEGLSRLSAQIQELASENNVSLQNMQQFTRKLNAARSGIISYQQFEPLFPAVFGQDGRRTYALVFQNEHELRATGGFIQAVALVTFENGILIDSQVFSSYQLDNQLAAFIEPPREVKNLLGEERFYLRDANWDPDFPNSASQIAWFIKQILNRDVDGVIALNINAFSQILGAVGPLELPQYNEIITDKNLAERMEFHSEVTLVETSESNDYSVILLRNLLQKVSTLSPDRIGMFLSSVQSVISQKQLFVHLLDENESTVIAGLGWNGALLSPVCPTQLSAAPCFVDSLAIVDTNIGVNKANYLVKRQDSHAIILNETSARHRHTIVLQNTAQSNSWPKGAYNSYLRIYLPTTISEEILKVNGENVALEELSDEVLGDKRVFGLRTTTPIKSESTITLEYSTPLLPEQIESESMSYVFFAQKQAGTGQPLTAVSVSYPPSFTPTIIAPQASVDLDSITFTNVGSEHVFVGTTYQKRN